MTASREVQQVHAEPRVAIVHDYLTQRGGAERVVLAMLQAFPSARLITTMYDSRGTYPAFGRYEIEDTWLTRVLPLFRDHRRTLPLLAITAATLRVDAVDLVICSSSGWAHWVRTDAPKIVYCHNPPRWIYQREEYLGRRNKASRLVGWLAAGVLRTWDKRRAHSSARYLANSSVVLSRVGCAYGLSGEVLHPPLSLDPGGPQARPRFVKKTGYFLTVGRPRAYKNTHILCEAFARMPHVELVAVGGVPERRGQGWPQNIVGINSVSDAELRWLYAHALATISVSHEDFGLTPIEGNSFGKPSLVLRAGGFLDTLREGHTGNFISEPTVEAVIGAVSHFDATDYNEVELREHAAAYSVDHFVASLQEVAYDVHQASAPQRRN